MDGLTEDDIYHPELMAVLDGKKNISVSFWWWGGKWGSDEDLAEQAIEIIRKRGKASATMLQRTLNVGFARAARIMDMLEERGVVGPQDWAKAREIMI
jgi:DNA segregation ATPase FtsK/SpoIIIE-like protein